MKKNLYLVIAGTMGSGKTTAASLLAKELKFQLLEENFGTNAFLPRFYKEMNRWAFHSQTFFLMEKINQALETANLLKKYSVIQDTPIEQDVFSYAKAQAILGNMDEGEWNLYLKIYRKFLPFIPKPDRIIYLNTSLEKIKQRIFTRNRNFENKVPEGYLELLDMLNDKWLKNETKSIQTIRINTDNLNIAGNKKDKKTFVDIVRKKLKI